MKKKLLGGLLVVAIAAVAAFNVNMNTQENELSALTLANVEALASNEGGTSHSLSCGSAGVKMCEATCGIHQVTVKNYGNGKESKFTCGS